MVKNPSTKGIFLQNLSRIQGFFVIYNRSFYADIMGSIRSQNDMSAWKWDCIPSNCHCLGWHPMQPQLLVQPFQQQFFARFSRASSWWAPHILHEKALASYLVVMPHHNKQLLVGVLFLKVFPVRAWNIEELYKQTHHQPDSQRDHSLPSLCSRWHPFQQIRNCSDRCVRWSSLQVCWEFDSQVFEPPFYELYFNIKYHLIINTLWFHQTWQWTIHHV